MRQRFYLDSSALIKLVQDEQESEALERALSGQVTRMSSELSSVEVVRRSRQLGDAFETQARRVLEDIALSPIDHSVVGRAAVLRPPGLRSLDAIQLATALALDPDAFISYDRRLNEAAAAAGLNVESPA